MTDAHCHLSVSDPSTTEFVVGRDFFGIHPWDADCVSDIAIDIVRRKLEEFPHAGVGEIGLDRLRTREIPDKMRTLFERQLLLALEYDRPVVLHGAKCWGQVLGSVKRLSRTGGGRLSFLFHGFSRSDGLLPEIVAMGGFISVGTAILNSHAVNYRELVRKIPGENLLVETDRTDEQSGPAVGEVLAALADVRGESVEKLECLTDSNARRFFGFDVQ